MRMSNAFPSKYLKAADIPEGRDVSLQIDEVRMESMPQSREEKPVLYFIGKEKGLILNVCNNNTIVDEYGDESEAWHGRPIVLFASRTDYQGKHVGCLRVRVPRSAPAPVAPRQETPVAADYAATDDIPF